MGRDSAPLIVDIARGVAAAGNPRFCVIFSERLFLFGLEASRDAFAANPASFSARLRAGQRWSTGRFISDAVTR